MLHFRKTWDQTLNRPVNPSPSSMAQFRATRIIFWGNYNAIQGQLQRRFAQGLQFMVSYTYSKCLNVDGGEFDAYPQNTYDVAADYGPCQQNFPQLFVFSGIYSLPFGRGEQFGSGVGKGMNFLIGGWN